MSRTDTVAFLTSPRVGSSLDSMFPGKSKAYNLPFAIRVRNGIPSCVVPLAIKYQLSCVHRIEHDFVWPVPKLWWHHLRKRFIITARLRIQHDRHTYTRKSIWRRQALGTSSLGPGSLRIARPIQEDNDPKEDGKAPGGAHGVTAREQRRVTRSRKISIGAMKRGLNTWR